MTPKESLLPALERIKDGQREVREGRREMTSLVIKAVENDGDINLNTRPWWDGTPEAVDLNAPMVEYWNEDMTAVSAGHVTALVWSETDGATALVRKAGAKETLPPAQAVPVDRIVNPEELFDLF